jgi:hypothetical protein
VLRVLLLACLKHLARRTPIAYGLVNRIRTRVHQRLTGRPVPDFTGVVPVSERTPVGRLQLKPGEVVRVKPRAEIERTLNVKGANAGLYFDVEMSPYCGRVVRVQDSVTQIVDEYTGRMRTMKQPCIMLEDVVCKSEYSECRLMCPRAIYSYWREVWLDRVETRESDAKAKP